MPLIVLVIVIAVVHKQNCQHGRGAALPSSPFPFNGFLLLHMWQLMVPLPLPPDFPLQPPIALLSVMFVKS